MLAVQKFILIINYRMEGKFGSWKIWWIHCMNTLAEENLANCEILQVKISRKTYSIKHSERLHHATNLWHEPCCDAMLCSSFTHLKPLSESQNQIWCWSSASWCFVLHLFNLSICQFHCLGWHKITQTTGRLRQSMVLYNRGCTVEVLYFKINIDVFQHNSTMNFVTWDFL